ncbi:hypothetical protein [Sinosporangium siamense]|uniref:Uncharacterized protein n=1 Tax=Sinosporangium siamense TaxID=1367973 RepID=A0A919VAM9_9ACTN|nr:hypothetical protein [Sinosporangium siamense]GII95597.1 hypothetical protein Ssi02_58280 [Sinosporangium siamense]
MPVSRVLAATAIAGMALLTPGTATGTAHAAANRPACAAATAECSALQLLLEARRYFDAHKRACASATGRKIPTAEQVLALRDQLTEVWRGTIPAELLASVRAAFTNAGRDIPVGGACRNPSLLQAVVSEWLKIFNRQRETLLPIIRADFCTIVEAARLNRPQTIRVVEAWLDTVPEIPPVLSRRPVN